eukprot:1668781-Prymnesium_polylepis.1
MVGAAKEQPISGGRRPRRRAGPRAATQGKPGSGSKGSTPRGQGEAPGEGHGGGRAGRRRQHAGASADEPRTDDLRAVLHQHLDRLHGGQRRAAARVRWMDSQRDRLLVPRAPLSHRARRELRGLPAGAADGWCAAVYGCCASCPLCGVRV